MSDIRTLWDQDRGYGDYAMDGPDLADGYDLMTNVLISLFSDGLARADDVLPDNSMDRRGWWGTFDESVGIGSRLWLLDRSKLTQAVALAAQNYAAEALQWMIDDGAVAVFDFSTEIRLPATLILSITAYRSKGAQVAKKYAWTWEGPVLNLVNPTQVHPALVTETGIVLTTEDGTVIVA